MIDSDLLDSKILVVDDTAENLELLVRILRWGGYNNVKTESDPALAFDDFQLFEPDLMILDLHMPKVDGYQILGRIQASQDTRLFVPILVYTGDVSDQAKRKALGLGASDFVTKPGVPSEILLRVRNFLRSRKMHVDLAREREVLEDRVAERTADLLRSRVETLDCLALAAEFRDDVTGQHAQRVGELSASIARSLGLAPEMAELIRLAAPLHDIGKIGIPDSILLKQGILLLDEFEHMKQHVTVGAGILARGESPVIVLAREIALNHHERWDGTGYCNGLAGEEIPLAARIVSVADAFDAMTHDRPYQLAKPEDEACARICAASGSQFDPRVVQAFCNDRGTIGLRAFSGASEGGA